MSGTWNAYRPAGEETGLVMTVRGPVAPETLGFTLTHEHVLVDFIGAADDKYISTHAYEVSTVQLAER